ncbi:MAG: 4'-phosphopantetheinyl transferase superfamily protein [Nocardioides sp.]
MMPGARDRTPEPEVAMRWLAASETSLPTGTSWLSPREAAYLETVRFTKRRTEFLLRRHTGKRAVCAVLDLPTDPGMLARVELLNRPSGAPYALVDGAPAALDISLSDRAGWAVALVGGEGSMANGTLGIDLELAEPRSAGFLTDFLTEAEQAFVGSLPAEHHRHAAANVIWSAKEAALKVLQVGLRADTRTVEVDLRRPADAAGGVVDGWRPLSVRHVEGSTFPGWWRRDSAFLLPRAGREPAPPPSLLPGGDDLTAATPIHSWLASPVVTPE